MNIVNQICSQTLIATMHTNLSAIQVLLRPNPWLPGAVRHPTAATMSMSLQASGAASLVDPAKDVAANVDLCSRVDADSQLDQNLVRSFLCSIAMCAAGRLQTNRGFLNKSNAIQAETQL